MWVSPSRVCTPGYLKGKQTPSHLRGSSSFRLILQYFRFSPGFPETCTIPKLWRIPAFAMVSRTYKPNAQSQTLYPKPKRVSENKPMPESSATHLRTKHMPDARATCPDPQRISKARNKRAPGSYLNKGSVVRVWRAAPFSTISTIIHYTPIRPKERWIRRG